MRTPWIGPELDEASAVRGIHSVTMTVDDPRPTLAFMREWLGFDVSEEMEGRTRVSVNGEGPGKSIDIRIDPAARRALNGIGTVHHVAMAIGSEEEQLTLRTALVQRGIDVTPVMDRSYFKSIYFREPGGVLFEVATTAPGFDVDEPLAELGRELKLPPWEEPKRKIIEAALPAVRY
jgi:glyoxalase family protein